MHSKAKLIDGSSLHIGEMKERERERERVVCVYVREKKGRASELEGRLKSQRERRECYSWITFQFIILDY